MGQETCSYCGGSGRDAINPTHQSCYKCHGFGYYWVPDPIKSYTPGTSSSSSVGNTSSSSNRQYQMLPWMQKVLDAIPGWLSFLFAVLGSGAGIALAQMSESASNSRLAIFAVCGFFIGFVLLRLAVVLVDFAIQFTIVLVKIAFVVAIVGGTVYGVIKYLGN